MIPTFVCWRVFAFFCLLEKHSVLGPLSVRVRMFGSLEKPLYSFKAVSRKARIALVNEKGSREKIDNR